ncbi:MAG TPA: hypothetical protein VGD87_06315 [Archangium sp.]
MFQDIRRDYETDQGLAWFIRALMLVGRDPSPLSRAFSLDVLQSMLAVRGGHEDLLEALDVVKRSVPGYAERAAELEREMVHLNLGPEVTDEERARVSAEAARDAVGDSGMSPEEYREIIRHLADPLIPEETKTAVRERLKQMIAAKHARRSD